MKSTTLAVTALSALIAFAACKKEKNVLPGNSGNGVETASDGKNKRHVPQATLGKDNSEVPQLINAFKQSLKKGSANAKLVDVPVSLGYAASIIEATLNYDHDGLYDKTYALTTENISVNITVDGEQMASSDAVEEAYAQLNAYVVAHTSPDNQLLMINIESYLTDAGTGVIEAEAQFFMKWAPPYCDLPTGWLKYPVRGTTRQAGSSAAGNSNTCNTMWQDNNPSNTATYSSSGIDEISAAIMCRFKQPKFICDLRAANKSSYYWFPIAPPMDLYGSYLTASSTLYSSGLQSLPWYCTNAGYMTASTANTYKTNLINAVLAYLPGVPATMPPGSIPTGASIEVISTQIINQSTWQNYSIPNITKKSIYWDFKAQFGVRNCYINPN
jgi:hypothetical protein